jgi:hypothetical protein
MKRVRHEDLAREFLSQGWSPGPISTGERSRHENLQLDFDFYRLLSIGKDSNRTWKSLTPCCSDAPQLFANLTSGLSGGKPSGRTGFQERIIFQGEGGWMAGCYSA